MKICAFDIGGTNIKFGVLTDDGHILFKSQMATKAISGGLNIIERVIAQIKILRKSYDIKGVSISTAGQINSEKGHIVFAVDTIPRYTGLKIKEIIEESVQIPVIVENDVNCAALGEYWKGVAVGYSDFICMTLGTGIGGSIISHSKVYYGANFLAGEFGHLNLYPNGKNCSCGSKGCYEQYASSKALSNLIKKEYGFSIDLKDFFQFVKEDNIKANSVLNIWVRDVALGLKSIVHIFNPELIIIGGGISEQGEYLTKKISSELSKLIMPSFREHLVIKPASRGNDSNLLGAVYNWVMKYSSNKLC